MRGLILSAGLGERLRPLTLRKAKPAIEFLNIPMLGFPYYWLNTLGLSQLVFNTHYLPDSIRHAAMHVIDPSIHLHFTHEVTILGSGGGIGNARALLEGERNFVVANGDGVILCEYPDVLEQMLIFHEKKDSLCTLLVCPLEGVGSRLPGVWMDNSGEIVNFGKTAKRDYTECLHYASYMILSKRIWNYIPEGSSNILYDVVEPNIQAAGEKAYGFRVDNMKWYETGNAAEYLAATRDCLELMRSPSAYGRCARDLVTKLAPRSELREMQLIADSARVEGRLKGFQVIGEDCVVPASAILEDSVLLPGTEVAPGSEIKNQVLIS
jgi:NDP-sugar pyrophosphorylase family protein